MTRALAAFALSFVYGCTGNTGTLNLFPEAPTESGGGSSCATGSCDTGGGGTGGALASGGTRNAPDASMQRTDATAPPPETGGAGTCATERDCRSGEGTFCVASHCVECRADDDCTSGERHYCSDNRCVQCRSDDDCTVLGDKPGCVLPTGRCDDCSNDSQCEPGEHCNVDEGKCR
jgi:Cys-rich repeat protein